jgi:hypothetical protein
MREKKNALRLLIGKSERKIPLGRPRRMWVYVINMKLRELVCGMKWIGMDRNRDQWMALVNAAMNLPVPLNAWHFLSSNTYGGL